MSDYITGASNLQIEVETNLDLTGATSLLIKYEKPDRKRGAFTATINGSDASKMYYNVTTTTEIDIGGDWKFWGWATLADGRVSIGKVKVQKIKAEGEI